MSNFTVSIKKGSIVIKLDRSDLVEVSHTADGMVFNFKNGCHFYYTDSYMPLPTKNQIKGSYDTFDKGNIKIDLDNYKQPISVEI